MFLAFLLNFFWLHRSPLLLYQATVFKMHSTAWVTCRRWQCFGLQCNCVQAANLKVSSELQILKDDALRMAARSKAQLPIAHDDRESVLNYFFLLKRATRLQPRKLSEAVARKRKSVLIFTLRLFFSRDLRMAARTSKMPANKSILTLRNLIRPSQFAQLLS